MDLTFTAAIIAVSIVANLTGEVMSEMVGQYVASSYEDYLWSGDVAMDAVEPDPLDLSSLSIEELHALLELPPQIRPEIVVGGMP